MLFEMLQERKISVVVGFFENVLKIAARLVRVNEQGEMEILRHGDSFFSLLLCYQRKLRRNCISS
jgi:hypothetical protein